MKAYTRNSPLVRASEDVIHLLCKLAENIFRQYENSLPSKKEPMQFLIIKILNELSRPLFKVFDDHVMEMSAAENHRYFLLKIILFEFFNLRLHHYASLINENVISLRIRNACTKNVIFQHQ